MSSPEISVLMPVRDGAAYLRPSIDSVLAQTMRNFELVVVDDGSTDATPDILGHVAAGDRRIVPLRQQPLGLVAALNRGIAAARAAIIARLDADDMAAPDRLQRQFEAMRADPELGLLGSHAETIDDAGRVTGQRVPDTSHDRLVAILRKGNPFVHSTVAFRKPLVVALGGFRNAFEAAEDYDLWLRISERARIANLPERLVRYREHGGGVFARNTARSAFSVRLAQRSAAMRQSGRPDPADELREPPDWRHPPPDAFYLDDARDFSLLELANPDIAQSLPLEHLDAAVLKGLARRLNHQERKLAQRALLNLIERPDRPPGFERAKLWATFVRLHPLRAAAAIVSKRMFAPSGVRRRRDF